MTPQELYELTTKLYECSLLMEKINKDCSDILLQMASETMTVMKDGCLPEEIKLEIDAISAEILADD